MTPCVDPVPGGSPVVGRSALGVFVPSGLPAYHLILQPQKSSVQMSIIPAASVESAARPPESMHIPPEHHPFSGGRAADLTEAARNNRHPHTEIRRQHAHWIIVDGVSRLGNMQRKSPTWTRRQLFPSRIAPFGRIPFLTPVLPRRLLRSYLDLPGQCIRATGIMHKGCNGRRATTDFSARWADSQIMSMSPTVHNAVK